MTTNEAIEKIMKATSVVDLFSDLSSFKNEYKNLAILVHPDHCTNPKGEEAFKKLAEFARILDKGQDHVDDAGTLNYKLTKVTLKGTKELIQKSLSNYNSLFSLKDKASETFKKYLPVSMLKLSDTELSIALPQRAIPLSSLPTLPHEHVNWILSRMLEFSAYLNQFGYVHCGLNPDSIYVVPETHGIVCISFYHLTKLDSKLKTVSARYVNFYPPSIFDKKKAISNIDVVLAKRTAIYLLGDASGAGVKLRKTHNLDFLDFCFKDHFVPFDAYDEYRKMLKKHFDMKKFHVLKV
jgi:hypothetical protein